jgi:formylglycine-generating enzyme
MTAGPRAILAAVCSALVLPCLAAEPDEGDASKVRREHKYWEARSHVPEFEKVGPEAMPAAFKPYAERSPRYEFKLDLVPVPGGHFEMSPLIPGDERRSVDVPDLWVGRTEVPCEAFEPFLSAADLSREALDDLRGVPYYSLTRPLPHLGCTVSTGDFWKRNHPADSISRKAAEAYCDWLSKKTGRTYRLPTEAEFEYFARAGNEHPLSNERLLDSAWCRENSATDDPDGEPRPRPVATRKPNAWGLYDTLGNLAEHVTPATDDPQVVRGGSWKTPAARVNPARREPFSPTWRDRDPHAPKVEMTLSDGDFIGLRIVRDREEKR